MRNILEHPITKYEVHNVLYRANSKLCDNKIIGDLTPTILDMLVRLVDTMPIDEFNHKFGIYYDAEEYFAGNLEGKR